MRLCQHTFPSEGPRPGSLLVVRNQGVPLSILLAVILAGTMFHTTDSLDNWVGAWSREAMREGESIPWVEDWTDMADRHPQFFGRHVHVAGGQISSANWTVGVSAGVGQWRSLVATYFRPGDVDTALRIMSCESGGNPSAKNPNSSATGLFQHLSGYWASRSAAAGWGGYPRTDPVANVAVAAWLRDQRGGWNHWRACL